MKEFVISEAKVETAILVGLITQTQDERKTNEYLDELAFLAETAGAEVVKRFTQKLPTANSVTYVGKGKLEEIRTYIRNEEEEERPAGPRRGPGEGKEPADGNPIGIVPDACDTGQTGEPPPGGELPPSGRRPGRQFGPAAGDVQLSL